MSVTKICNEINLIYLKEKEKLKTVREHSGSPTPHRMLGQRSLDETEDDKEVEQSLVDHSNGGEKEKTKISMPGKWSTGLWKILYLIFI